MIALPKLYKQTSTGKIQEWEIYSAFSPDDEGAATIVTTYGLKDGKKQTAGEIIRYGKNLGKANATTPLEQAQLEAQSQWEHKLKKGYVQSLEDAEAGKTDAIIQGGVAPMLAHGFDKQGHKIVYPAFVQPKLDGHRCIAIVQDGKCTLWSRTQKRINSMVHIAEQIEELAVKTGEQNFILDGELYNHAYRDKFELLTSEIKQQKPRPGSLIVQYWIYDKVNSDKFEDRTMELNRLKSWTDPKGHLFILPTFEAGDKDEMFEIQVKFIEQGFEGLMVRNKNGLYKNRRSYDLQKVKTFQDAEFPVVDIIGGKGKMAEGAIFVCEVENGETFTCVMKCSLAEREHYLRHKDQYIGKKLTVKFQKWSAKGMPIFPVAIRFREDV